MNAWAEAVAAATAEWNRRMADALEAADSAEPDPNGPIVCKLCGARFAGIVGACRHVDREHDPLGERPPVVPCSDAAGQLPHPSHVDQLDGATVWCPGKRTPVPVPPGIWCRENHKRPGTAMAALHFHPAVQTPGTEHGGAVPR